MFYSEGNKKWLGLQPNSKTSQKNGQTDWHSNFQSSFATRKKNTFEPIYLWRYAIGIILEQDRRTKDLRSVIEMLRHLRWLLINIHLIVISYASSNFFILEATSQVLSGSRPTVQYIRLAVQNSTVQYNVGLIPVLSGFRPTV